MPVLPLLIGVLAVAPITRVVEPSDPAPGARQARTLVLGRGIVVERSSMRESKRTELVGGADRTVRSYYDEWTLQVRQGQRIRLRIDAFDSRQPDVTITEGGRTLLRGTARREFQFVPAADGAVEITVWANSERFRMLAEDVGEWQPTAVTPGTTVRRAFVEVPGFEESVARYALDGVAMQRWEFVARGRLLSMDLHRLTPTGLEFVRVLPGSFEITASSPPHAALRRMYELPGTGRYILELRAARDAGGDDVREHSLLARIPEPKVLQPTVLAPTDLQRDSADSFRGFMTDMPMPTGAHLLPIGKGDSTVVSVTPRSPLAAGRAFFMFISPDSTANRPAVELPLRGVGERARFFLEASKADGGWLILLQDKLGTPFQYDIQTSVREVAIDAAAASALPVLSSPGGSVRWQPTKLSGETVALAATARLDLAPDRRWKVTVGEIAGVRTATSLLQAMPRNGGGWSLVRRRSVGSEPGEAGRTLQVVPRDEDTRERGGLLLRVETTDTLAASRGPVSITVTDLGPEPRPASRRALQPRRMSDQFTVADEGWFSPGAMREYRVDLKRGQLLTVRMRAPVVDGELELLRYQQAGPPVRLAFNDNTPEKGDGGDAELTWRADADGTYLLRVMARPGDLGAYDLYTTVE